jgi:uncharacterized protein (TIGR02266 family)
VNFTQLIDLRRFALVDPNTRQGKRTPVTLKIKFKSETLEQFIERYAVDVSQGGIFIRTKEPLAVGTQMRFEFQLRDASPLIGGEGTVVWTRENDPSRPAIAPGMGVRFDRLAEGSQTVLERILQEKAKQAPQRHESATKPPLFTDTPTKVAPLPVQEALLGDKRRSAGDNFSDQHTPLPKPMPFHSDADDFDEQAFEEATKVRALDELIAQTAEGNEANTTATAVIPQDELAARRVASGGRADSTLADPPFAAPQQGSGPIGVAKTATDRDSAPGLPSPPSAGPAPRLLDTSPSPRSVEAPTGDLGKTKLGFDAPRAGTPSSPPKASPAVSRTPTPSSAAITKASGQQPVVATSVSRDSGPMKHPMAPAKKSSAVPTIILLLVLLAAAGAAAWFFYFRPKAEEAAAIEKAKTTPGSAAAVQTGSDGSAVGKVVEAPGSNGSATVGSAGPVETPKGPVVDTVIASSVDKAVIEIVGTDQKGPAPLTAKLEKDKDYKARISAPGFAALEMDIKGGQDKIMAKLTPKPRVITVTSEPAGALIFVDGATTGHTTPFDVELTKAQAAKKTVKVSLRKGGYRQLDKMLAVDAYAEEDARLLAKVQEKLAVQQQVVRPPPDKGSGTNPGSGSATTPPPDPGSGSGTTTPTPTPTPTPPTPTPTTPTPTPGSAAKPPATTPPAAGSAAKPPTSTTTPPAPTPSAGAGATKPAEPEPDFTKR